MGVFVVVAGVSIFFYFGGLKDAKSRVDTAVENAQSTADKARSTVEEIRGVLDSAQKHARVIANLNVQVREIAAQSADSEVLSRYGLGRSEFDELRSEIDYTQARIDQRLSCLTIPGEDPACGDPNRYKNNSDLSSKRGAPASRF